MIIGFNIYRGTTVDDVVRIATMNELDYIDTNVSNGLAYIYYVAAFNEYGIGKPSVALDAIPFGVPSKVMGLQAKAGNGYVLLTWTEPDNNGRRITGYNIYAGQSPSLLNFLVTSGDVTYNHTDVINGKTYYYNVTAINEAGEGVGSVQVSARPLGLPGVPEQFTATLAENEVKLSWQDPTDLGGASNVRYRVLKGTAVDALSLLVELTDATEYSDADVTLGATYYYAVKAVNNQGEGPLSEVLSVAMLRTPGPVVDLVATAGNNQVELIWSAPVNDGGSPVTKYIVLRGLFETALSEIAQVTELFNYTDTDVENGKTYYYAVRAVNAVGKGASLDTVSAMPLGPPGAPIRLETKVEGDAIVLTWSAPTPTGTALVTGYVVYRGTSEGDLQLLAEVGDVLIYTDDDVENYYTVVPKSASGDGDMSAIAKIEVKKKEDGPAFHAFWTYMAMTVIALVILSRRRSYLAPD
jgi:titin